MKRIAALNRSSLLIAIATIAGALLIGAIAWTILRQGGDTFVRIVDKTELEMGKSPSPGADIEGAAILNGKKKKPTYAQAVVNATILNGGEGNTNEYDDASVAVGDPADEKNSYVALGGGELILRVHARLKPGDDLVVYELGSSNSAHPEYFEAYTSDNADGPWELQGTGSGTTTFAIQ